MLNWRKHRVKPKSTLYMDNWRRLEEQNARTYQLAAVAQQSQQDMAYAHAIAGRYGLPDVSHGRGVAGGTVASVGGRAGAYNEAMLFERGPNWDRHNGQTYSLPEINSDASAAVGRGGGGAGGRAQFVVGGPGARGVDAYMRPHRDIMFNFEPAHMRESLGLDVFTGVIASFNSSQINILRTEDTHTHSSAVHHVGVLAP